MEANSRIEHLLQFITEDPQDVFSRYALALELINIGKLEDARYHMEFIHKQHPGYLANYYQFGKLSEQLGNSELAIELYRQGMEVAQSQKNIQTYSELKTALEGLIDPDY